MKIVVSETRDIVNLPQYLGQRLVHLTTDIERMESVGDAINVVRSDLPDGALEAEKK